MKTMYREERRKKKKMPAAERCRYRGKVERVNQEEEKVFCWSPVGMGKYAYVVKMGPRMSWMMSEPANPCRCPQSPEFARAGWSDGCQWGSAAPVGLRI